MQTILKSLNVDDLLACPVCLKRLKTQQGVLAHLSSARRCREYNTSKVRELTMPQTLQEEELETEERDIAEAIPAPPQVAPEEIANDFYGRFYDLVPTEPQESNEGGSTMRYSPERETEIDERVEEDPFPLAGTVIRMDQTLHDRWRQLFGENDEDGDTLMNDEGQDSSSRFTPFASEQDWRVARWAIQEGIGHKSLDRLLSIPGVSV